MSPERSITAVSSVHQGPHDTATLDADDFTLPELRQLVFEFEVVALIARPGTRAVAT